MSDPVKTNEPLKLQEDVATLPSVNAITDRQLLVDVSQKLSALVTTVKDGFETAASRDLELAQRVTTLESRMGTAEGRLDKNSSGPSKHDIETQSALAAEVESRTALAKKVDALGTKVSSIDEKTDEQTALLKRLEGAVVTWYSSPAGKVVRYIAWGAVAGWLARNNIHIPGVN